MSQWVRLWEDMPTDPKWRVVARRAGRSLPEVLAVFVFMLTNASKAQERGTLANWNDEDVGAAIDVEAEHVAAIREAMQGKTLDGEKLTGWDRRQPKREDNAAERAKEWRKNNRTQPNATERTGTQESAHKRPDTDTDTDTDTEKIETAAAVSCAAAVEKIDEGEVERRCVQATGWQSTQGFSAILDLMAEGHSLDERILPMLRTIAGELRERKQSPPKVWAFVLKAIRDPTRRPISAETPVETAWVPQGSPVWRSLCGVKKESWLRSMLKPGPGGEGIYWPVADLPRQSDAA